MELKTKYQYTYFIHPYVIKENKYEKYILRLLKDKKCSLKVFQKEKDLNIYTYFLPKVRKFLFPTFDFNRNRRKQLGQLDPKMQATILAKYPCMIFEYDIKQGLQGKAGEENSIFFKIQKVEIICFKIGICFLSFKTHLEDTQRFSDILNFNYRFQDIHSELSPLKEFENIKIQTDRFENIYQIGDFIKQITGPNVQTMAANIETEKFYTYSYVCIDPDSWNETKPFSEIEHEFLKYYKILPSSNQTSFHEDAKTKQVEMIADWEYVHYGFSKLGCCLLASGIDTNNYTKLPFAYENEYFYTYLLFLYEKIYLEKLNYKSKGKKQQKKIRKQFTFFTQNLWKQDVTNHPTGHLMCKKWKKVLELEDIFHTQKEKLDVLYKEMRIEKTEKINKVILVVLGISLLLNIINYIVLFSLN